MRRKAYASCHRVQSASSKIDENRRIDGWRRGTKLAAAKRAPRTERPSCLRKKGREALAEVLGANAFEGDAHSLLIAVYKDESHPIELRLEAAKAAIRFEKPALAAVDTHGTID
jgi:hypothetical protein